MKLIAFLLIFTITPFYAAKASASGSDRVDWANLVDPNQYGDKKFTAYYPWLGGTWKSGQDFPVLKNPIPIAISAEKNSPLQGFSHPDVATGTNSGGLFQVRYNCHYSGQLHGEIINVTGDTAAVRLKNPTNCQYGQLNGDDRPENDIVFFPIKSLDPKADLSSVKDAIDDTKTEAALPPALDPQASPESPIHHDASIPEDVANVMSGRLTAESPKSSKPSTSTKSPSELEQYIDQNCTRYQPDYDNYYREIIDTVSVNMGVGLIEKTTATCPPKGPNKKQLPSIFPIVKGDEFEKTDQPSWPKNCVASYVHPDSAVLKCVSRKESLWDNQAKSPTGAIGLGQQTNINVLDIAQALYGGKGVSALAWALPVWEKGVQSIYQKFPIAQHPDLYKNRVTGENCDALSDLKKITKGNVNDRKPQIGFCPVTSILATAFYQMMTSIDVRRSADVDLPVASGPPMDISTKNPVAFVAASGWAHNKGRGGTAVAAKKGPMAMWAKIASMMEKSPARSHEVREYSKDIEHCIRAGDQTEMTKGDRVACDTRKDQHNFESRLPVKKSKSATGSQSPSGTTK